MANNNSPQMLWSFNKWMFIGLTFLLLQTSCKQKNDMPDASKKSFSFSIEKGASKAENRAHHLEFAAKANQFEIKQTYQNTSPISFELKKLKVDDKTVEIVDNPTFELKESDLQQVSKEYTIEYVNDDKGLRQNFIIAGEGSGRDVSFELELGVISELEMRKINDFGIEFVDGSGIPSLTYKDLITFDDNNKILDSRMSFEKLESDQYRILIKGNGRDVSFPITIDPLMTSNSAYENGMAGNETGTSVEGRADIDGDGFCDLIVGSPGFIRNGVTNVGKIEIFLGTISGINLNVPPNYTIFGDTLVKKLNTVSLGVGPRFGQSISVDGDINGDTYMDILVGAPSTSYIDTTGGANDTIYAAGAVYVFNIGSLEFDTLYGSQVNMKLGSTVAGLGDLNNDPYADFAIGAPGFQNNRGLVLVYRGKQDGFSSLPTDSLKGIQEGELFGSALAGVKDVGGDGRADILVGAHRYTNGMDTAAGRAVLFKGQAMALAVLQAWQGIGPHQNAYFGFSVAGGGNFNGAGLPDVLIGVKQFNQEYISTMTDTISGYGLGTGTGAVFVYQGTMMGLTASPITILKSEFPASGFGSSVSYAGDVDGDNLDDVLVGAPTFTRNFKDEGATFAYYGKNFQAGQDITFDWCAVGEKLEANFGSSLTNSGMCVADTSSIYIGAVGFPNNANLRSGGVFEYNGGRCGLVKVAEPMFTTFLPDTIFGVAALDTCGAIIPFMYPLIGVNCPDEASLSIITAIDSGGFFPIGDNLVTFRIESEGKIVDSSFIVKVFDNQAPELQTCPTTVSIVLMGTEESGAVTWTDPTFTDNSSCAGQSLTLVQESGPAKGSMQGIGVYQIVYKSTDESGNEAYCTFRVIVRKSGADGRDCNDQAINSNLSVRKTTNPDANFEYGEKLSDRMRGNPSFGVDLLISLFESVSGISIPGWVKSALGQFGNSVDLAFIKLEFLYAPAINMDYGVFYNIKENSPAVATMDYVGQVCAFKPADTFFGCRDTIDISTSFLVDPASSIMRVTPGGLKQSVGIYMRDFTFSWRIGIKVSGCIGIPLCLPFIGCAGCLGYEDSYDFGVDIFDPIVLLNSMTGDDVNIDLITACDQAFMPGASIVTAVDCSRDSAGVASSFIAGLVTELGANQVPGDPFFYDQVKDEFVFAPNRIPLLGNKIPEMDLRFGRLTQNEMNPSYVNGTALTVAGRNYNMFSATLDIFSLLYYALPQNIQQGLCTVGIDIGTRTINFGTPSIDPMGGKCSVKFYNTYLSLDVLDLNAILRAEYNAAYSFDPQITIDSMNLGFPTYWERPDAMVPTSGMSQKIENVGMDEKIRFVVPDGLTDPFFIGNEFSAAGSFVGQDNKSQKLDFGIKMFELIPALRFPISLGPLINLGPYNILTLSNTNIRNYNEPIIINGFSALVTMLPDDIKPVIVTRDTTVFLDDSGLAYLDAETAFNRELSYDLPVGGSGMLNLIDVFPDTITCSDYPSVTAYIVVEDDNCNFDTAAFNVTVMDTLSPRIACVDIVVGIGANGTYVLNPDEIAIGITDNCRNITVTASPSIFNCEDVGIPQDVTITAVDVAGNSSSCVASVTVVDTLEPQITCPYLPAYPPVRFTIEGLCVYIPNDTEFRPTVVANDCQTMLAYTLSGATIGSGVDNVAGVPFNLGETFIVYTATDASGNTYTCSFSVIVEDNEPPSLICPANITISTNEDGADDYNCSTSYTWTHPTPIDNCTSIASYMVTYEYPDGSGAIIDLLDRLGANDLEETMVLNLGVTTITYDAVDTMGNNISCSFTILVADDEIPMIFCDQVIGCESYTTNSSLLIAPNDSSIFNISVPNDIQITDVNLHLQISTGDASDLEIILVNPAGATVALMTNICPASPVINVHFDEEAINSVSGACATIQGGDTLRGEEALSLFYSTSSLGDWKLIINSSNTMTCGTIDSLELEICGLQNSGTDTTRVSILASAGCEYSVLTPSFDPPFTDNCDGSTLSHNYIFSPNMASLTGTVLPLGETTVLWTVTDASGNTSTCVMIYEVKDKSAPYFINCPEPDIVLVAEPSTCGAFVNFATPIAFDDCDGLLTVTQVDDTGLSSGSVFPVGMSIIIFQATDVSGNTAQCIVRVIVNDSQNGLFACPANVVRSTDVGVFSAVVNGIAPVPPVDNCVNNNSIVYQVEFPNGSGQIVGSGVADASGDSFRKGVSEVTYRLTSQPVLLISEVTQEIQAPVGGMGILPYTISTNDDYVELTNLGPANYNISGLMIERFGSGFSDQFEVPNKTILLSGETLVLHFGNGTDDIPAHFFNMPCALDISGAEPAAYVISFKGRVIDVTTTNGYNPTGLGMSAVVVASDLVGSSPAINGFGGLIRKYSYDNNAIADFVVSENCYPLTIGMLNPDIEVNPGNGTTTALQSIAPQVMECSFLVTVNDLEAPRCMELVSAQVYNGGPVAGGYDSCNESEILIPNGDDCIIDSIKVSLQGSFSGTDSIFVELITPSGQVIHLIETPCAGNTGDNVTFNITINDLATSTLSSLCGSSNWAGSYNNTGVGDSLQNLYGMSTGGVWRLKVGARGTSDSYVNITGWSLDIICLSVFQMANAEIENEVGQCGSLFTWTHPYLLDNSNAGEVQVTYTTMDADCKPVDVILTGNGGQEVTQYFCVGTTTVSYTLTDGDGNQQLCSFDVTVLDTEDPVVNLANCQNVLIGLGSTQCDRSVIFSNNLATIGTDNCGVVAIEYSPASGFEFPIGITPVTLTIFDEAGNTDQCVFNVEVVEYLPSEDNFSCNGQLNISLDGSCELEITPGMILTGNDYRCFDSLCVSVVDSLGKPHSNLFTLADKGFTFKVSITDCRNNGNSCWGYVKIEEKLIPGILCPDDITILCGQSTEPDSTGTALLTSCEPRAEIYYEDRTQTFGQCNPIQSVITRTWFIDDHEGNIVSCIQRITTVPITLDSIIWPADIQVNNALECTDVVNNPGLILPKSTGYPTISKYILEEGNKCLISVIYDDEIFPLCEGAYVIARTWKILNACQPWGPNNPKVHTQAIRVFDNVAPVFKSCPENVTISTSAWQCYTDSYLLPLPEVADACGHMKLKAFIYGGGKLKTTGKISDGSLRIVAENLSKGPHEIVYLAEDGCGNVSQCSFIITVVDDTPPVASTKKLIVVNLTNSEALGGVAKIFAKDVNNGSYDNCSEVRLEIRREEGGSCGNEGSSGHNNNLTFNNLRTGALYSPLDTDGGDYVKFCCEDVNSILVDGNSDGLINESDRGYHSVILRVWDDGNMNNIIGDEGDHYNDTWSYIKVEDKLRKQILCAPDTMYCDEEIYFAAPNTWNIYDVDSSSIDASSLPLVESTCGFYDLEYKDEAHIGTCHDGYILRTWRIVGSNVSCVQRIEVLMRPRTAVLDYPITLHLWPNCTLSEAEVIASTLQAQKTPDYGGSGDGGPSFNIGPDGKPVIFNGRYQNVGCEIFGRDIKIEEFEVGDGCKKWLVRFNYINWCENADAGSRSTIYKYEDVIAPEIVVSLRDTIETGTNCLADYPINAKGLDTGGCSASMKWTISVSRDTYMKQLLFTGAEIKGNIIFKDLTPGNYKVHYHVVDGCGNVSEKEADLVVLGQIPIPYCIDVSSAVMKNGVVELWARDFDKGSQPACLPSTLYFTFENVKPILSKISEVHYFDAKGLSNKENYDLGLAQKWNPVSESSSKLFGCAVGEGKDFPQALVMMTVWNGDFRGSTCQVTLKLVDNQGACGEDQNVVINGGVLLEKGQAVKGMEIFLDAPIPEYPRRTLTDDAGLYAFNAVPKGFDYQIYPKSDAPDKRGINTLDLVHIQRHILSLKALDSPYKMIAADVTGDQAVRVDDIVALRKLILGVYTAIPESPTWKFVDAKLQMSQKPWPFQQVISHASLSEGKKADFVAIKMGDVDASLNLNLQNQLLTRDQGVRMTYDDQDLKEGEEFIVELKASSFEEVYGFQMALKLDGLTGISLIGQGINLDNSNYALFKDGTLTLSWSDVRSMTIKNGLPVMSLKVRANRNGKLSEMLSLDQTVFDNEAYVGGAISTTGLGLLPSALDQAFALYQNEPNPFRNETSISFKLPDAGMVNLSIIDITGKTIYAQRINGHRGINSVSLSRKDVGFANGLMIYRLESGAHSLQRKMIIIE